MIHCLVFDISHVTERLVHYVSLAYSHDSSSSLGQWLTRSAEPLSRRPLAEKVRISLNTPKYRVSFESRIF